MIAQLKTNHYIVQFLDIKKGKGQILFLPL